MFFADDGCRLLFDRGLLLFRMNRAFQDDVAVSSDDFDVVCVGGERFILHQRVANLPACLPIGRIHFLLIGGDFVFRTGAVVLLCVVCLGLPLVLGMCQERSAG